MQKNEKQMFQKEDALPEWSFLFRQVQQKQDNKVAIAAKYGDKWIQFTLLPSTLNGQYLHELKKKIGASFSLPKNASVDLFFPGGKNPVGIPAEKRHPPLQNKNAQRSALASFSEQTRFVRFVSQQQMCSQSSPEQVQQEEERRTDPTEHPFSSLFFSFLQKEKNLLWEVGRFLLFFEIGGPQHLSFWFLSFPFFFFFLLTFFVLFSFFLLFSVFFFFCFHFDHLDS